MELHLHYERGFMDRPARPPLVLELTDKQAAQVNAFYNLAPDDRTIARACTFETIRRQR